MSVNKQKLFSEMLNYFLERFSEIEEKVVSVLFLKIGSDYREKIYDYLKLMLNAIVNTRNL